MEKGRGGRRPDEIELHMQRVLVLAELRSCVKVEVAVPLPSLIIATVSQCGRKATLNYLVANKP